MQQMVLFVITLCAIAYVVNSEDVKKNECRNFPQGMLFGTATASYQIEGAWNDDGKSENIWDNVSHRVPCVVAECHTGDVAADSYNLYKRDVEMLREMGLHYYKFSLSWARILPSSFPDKVNEKGVEYYNNLIDELNKYNIEPMVTLYHWDLPQKLQELGGWTNPYVIDWFADYARVAFELFGDRVKYWITINEPHDVCYLGYGSDYFSPLLNMTGYAEYMCAKNILLAHAKVYHMYNNEYRSHQGSNVGIVINVSWFEPESEEHTQAADDLKSFEWGMYADPIFSKSGDFPQNVKERIAAKSLAQGFSRSRLPELSPEEIELIKGSADFFGVNHYPMSIAYRNESVYGFYPSPSFFDDVEVKTYTDSNLVANISEWLKVVPSGLYKGLTQIRKQYDNPPVFITEHGFSTQGGLEDDDRINYHRRYLDAMLDAIEEGSDIRGYTAWSLMDKFEWLQGYTEKYGLYEVDFESSTKTRTPRKSAYVYKQIARTRSLDFHYEPDMSVPLSIDSE